MALGYQAKANFAESYAIGTSVETTRKGQIALGKADESWDNGEVTIGSLHYYEDIDKGRQIEYDNVNNEWEVGPDDEAIDDIGIVLPIRMDLFTDSIFQSLLLITLETALNSWLETISN